jgi:hypothetical protein
MRIRLRPRHLWLIVALIAVVLGGLLVRSVNNAQLIRAKCEQVSVGMTLKEAERIMGRGPDGQPPEADLPLADSTAADEHCHYWFEGKSALTVWVDSKGTIVSANFIPEESFFEKVVTWIHDSQ